MHCSILLPIGFVQANAGKIFQGNVQLTVILENGLSMYMKPYSSEGTKKSYNNLMLNHEVYKQKCKYLLR